MHAWNPPPPLAALLALLACQAALAPAHAQASPEQVELRQAGTVIERSCLVRLPATPLAAPADGAVLRITGDDVTVHFEGALRGPGDLPSAYRGVGIEVTGQRVTLVGPRVGGYKVGLRAVGADGLVLEDGDVSGNYRQHLGSTPAAEDGADWLWPHANDGGEWARSYGAGILIERSQGVTVRRCRARAGQNGLLLDRVTGARIYDNDFSFLSGWGIALWRSSDNVITRNALDFCVRGYSHGVYNRGQDSAGILMFEQCSRNVIAENSATHGGDGFFGFGGKEALGEHPAPPGFSYEHKGNNGNLLLRNDFSYAVAHGIEMTFSFDNLFVENLLIEDGICGVWAGYSKDTLIARNRIERCGEMAYGLERGGVNIEHGERNRILDNFFVGNRCGVHLWWDADEGLTKLPWSQANGHGCGATQIIDNFFDGDEVALHVRDCPDVTFAGNFVHDVGEHVRAEGGDPILVLGERPSFVVPEVEVLGETRPVGARPGLAGRRRIVMTEWGPYDGAAPLLQALGALPGGGEGWRLLGAATGQAEVSGDVRLREEQDTGGTVFRILPMEAGRVARYELRVETRGRVLRATGLVVSASWEVRFFPWTVDPREDAAGWEAAAEAGVICRLDALELPFGGGGPSQLAAATTELREAALPADRFGTLARTRLTLPAGAWRVKTRSDDGIRVRAGDELLIDDWTWHGPTEHDAVLRLDEERLVTFEVRHFELDGHAVLSLSIEEAD